MAQKITVELIDDVDGGLAKETIFFGLDDQQFEIDLNGPNAEKLRSAFEPWITHGRRATGLRPAERGGSQGGRSSSAIKQRDRTVRAWVSRTGWAGAPVSNRGRLPQKALAAWEAAGSPPEQTGR